MSRRLHARALLPASRVVAAVAPAFSRRRLKRPTFIIGCARSGTTLLAQSLAVHPRIALYPNEANHLWHPELYPWVRSRHSVPPFWSDPRAFTSFSLSHRGRIPPERIGSQFGAFQLLHGGETFVNKSAMTAFMIPFMLDLFPDARFIHLVRNGYAVAFSYAQMQLRKQSAAPQRYAARLGKLLTLDELLEICAGTWTEHVLEVTKQDQQLDLEGRGVMIEVRYESLCANPAREFGRLAEFLDVSPAVFERRDYSYVTPRNETTFRRLTTDQRRAMQVLLEPALEMFRYPHPT